MAKLLALLLIVPLVYGQIHVKIVASDDNDERSVDISGKIVDIISDKEIIAFDLTDHNLKDAVNKNFGSTPTKAFLKSPTPWGDLYKVYPWKQVTRILAPLKATILSVSSESMTIMNQILHNMGSEKATFTAKLQHVADNTVSSTWEKGGDLTVAQEIEYGFDLHIDALSGKTSFAYNNKWGVGAAKVEPMTIGSASGVEIELEAGQKVMAELHVNKTTMKVQVDYEATLLGDTAVYYSNTYKDQHFWGLKINEVMKSGGLKRYIKSKEVIIVSYYSNPKIDIHEMNSNALLHSIPMNLL